MNSEGEEDRKKVLRNPRTNLFMAKRDPSQQLGIAKKGRMAFGVFKDSERPMTNDP